MQGVRIQLRYLGFGSTGFLPVLPGEPVFDPVSKRLGVGIGGHKAAWFPRPTESGELEFDTGQGLINYDGSLSIKFNTTGISWRFGNNEILATRGNDGIAVRSAMLMRNEAGVDTVLIGFGHYMALIAMLRNLKALLREIIAGTATNGDIDALLNPDVDLDLTKLNPAFPEASSL